MLYAASQRYRFPLSVMRGLWLGLGDLATLLSTTRPALSLLDGDSAFLTPLAHSLSTLIRASSGDDHGTIPPQSLDLRLAATLVDPVVRQVAGPLDETLVERRHAAQFRFRHLEGQEWLPSDLPPVSPDEINAIAWRLALAARASSSYPVAFEAAVRPRPTSAPVLLCPRRRCGRTAHRHVPPVQRTVEIRQRVCARTGTGGRRLSR